MTTIPSAAQRLIEAALAQATRGLVRLRRDHLAPYVQHDCAAAILATPTGSALARLVEIGAAVERLPANVSIQHTAGGRWRLYLYDREPEVPMDGWYTAQAGSTLPAAAAALGDEQEPGT